MKEADNILTKYIIAFIIGNILRRALRFIKVFVVTKVSRLLDDQFSLLSKFMLYNAP